MPTVWKIAPGESASGWEMCRERGCIALGWSKLKDYSRFSTEEEVLKALGGGPGDGKGAAKSILRFASVIQPDDIVVANKGKSRVMGIGIIHSDYMPAGGSKNPSQDPDLPHARLVDWIIDKPIDVGPDFFGIHTITELSRDKVGQIEQAYLKEYPALKGKLDQLFRPNSSTQAASSEAPMEDLLRQLGQVIMYGPPGTGKTRQAKRAALALLSGGTAAADPSANDNDIEEQLKPFREGGRFDLVVFHPAYEYEQFVGGIEPTLIGGALSFVAKAGVFTRLCRKVREQKEAGVLIIDEINRGNLPKLLGELVYALEYRGHEVRLPFDDGISLLVVPKNLYIIATMNSADRSIGHIDVAIRRRFGLYHVPPKREIVEQIWSATGDEQYGKQLAGLMRRVNETLGGAQDPGAPAELGVGHSYFLPADGSSAEAAREQARMKWVYQVQPLLREYAQLLNLDAESLKQFSKPLDDCLDQP